METAALIWYLFFLCIFQTAVFVAPVTGIPVLLFSGFFVSFDTIPKYMQWLTYISFARYSWEGMLVAIYGNNRGALDCGDNPERCMFRQSVDVLNAMDIDETALQIEQGKFYFDCVVLGLFFVTLRLVTYLVLRHKIKTSAERWSYIYIKLTWIGTDRIYRSRLVGCSVTLLQTALFKQPIITIQ